MLNYATSSWFVNITKIKENLLDNAKNITWSPEHIKEGRFGKWLEGARDWSISRQRFWASVIPMWVCETCKTKRVFGSATELARLLAPLVSTLSIGQIILEGVKGKQWVHVSTREPERSINRIITITDAGVLPGIIGLA